MSRSSARRAQVEPVPALVAVLVLSLALGAYASVRAGVLPAGSSGAPAGPVLADAADAATPDGTAVVLPDRLTAAVTPAGYEASVTLEAAEEEWRAGPEPPDGAATASRRVPVRVAPDRVVPGRLRVEVWS
jgi:hypothetical protein